jgi:acetylornithine deacetylase/succinyl-diaminopimelate desuccinylase-like protein
MAAEQSANVHEFLAAHQEDMLTQLAAWVRIASVAGVPERTHELLRSANWLAGELRGIGFPTVEVWEAGGTAAVFAQWCPDPAAPTVLIYSHHDVRAVKEESWHQTSPFEAAVRDDRMYGRGTSDAKGQVLSHLWSVRTHLAVTGNSAPAVNLKLIIEGEEETGSPHLLELVQDHLGQLAADLVVFSDTLLWRADAPAIPTSLRGMISAHLEIRGPLRDVHSGAVSGPAPNPLVEMCNLLSQLHDTDGRIQLPGFYAGMDEISAERRAELAALPFSPEDWLARSSTRSISTEPGYTVLEQLWLRPSAEIMSIIGGDPVGASRAAVPAAATADLNFRIVQGQRPDDVAEQLRAWVAERISDGFDYVLTPSQETAQDPYVTPDVPAVAALERAMQQGFCTNTVGRMGNAGGGPASLLSSLLGAPVIFFGTGLIEDQWHDGDESIHLPTFLAGAATLAFLWNELAEQGP